jgi:hypothetical protein
VTDIVPESTDYLGVGGGQWDDTGQEQAPETVTVHVASSNARPVREAAPEYADCMNWSIDTFVNMGKPLMIMQRRYRRKKARILVASLGGPILAGSDQSLEFEGSAAAPAANGNVLNVGAGAVPAGTYSIQWRVGLDGTVSAADLDNFKLTINGLSALNSVNDPLVGDYQQPTIVATVTGLAAHSVKAIGAATAGSTYSAQIVFTPVIAPTAALIFNSRQEPLMQAVPVGYIVSAAPYELQWENQKPCYAVLQPGGTGPIAISVLDQAYEET